MSPEAAIELINTFLKLMAERKLDEAQQFLAANVKLVFPPSATFTNLQDMVQSARGRYRWCDKVRDRWDVVSKPDGSTVVYSLGTLFGVNVHGAPFEGVRYIDRFVLREGLIVEQEVWNDLAESGVLSRGQLVAEAR